MFAFLVFVSLYGSSDEKDDREDKRGWRVRFTSNAYRYDQIVDGQWRHIDFDVIRNDEGYGICGIIIKSRASWIAYPEWAQLRRDEIVDRVKGELPQFRFSFESECLD